MRLATSLARAVAKRRARDARPTPSRADDRGLGRARGARRATTTDDGAASDDGASDGARDGDGDGARGMNRTAATTGGALRVGAVDVPGVRDGGAVERAADAPGEVREGRARGGAGEDVDRRRTERDANACAIEALEMATRANDAFAAEVKRMCHQATGSGRWGADDGGGVRGGAGGADGASEDDAAEGEFSD